MAWIRKYGAFLLPALCAKEDADPDSAWKEQNKEMERNPIYKFVGLGVSVNV